jgi:hypothetical protein
VKFREERDDDEPAGDQEPRDEKWLFDEGEGAWVMYRRIDPDENEWEPVSIDGEIERFDEEEQEWEDALRAEEEAMEEHAEEYKRWLASPSSCDLPDCDQPEMQGGTGLCAHHTELASKAEKRLIDRGKQAW